MTPDHRQFKSGANRDSDLGKLDYEGFLSPLVLERYAQYLNDHRKLPDGTLRDSDNWQKGIPFEVYIKSGLRHVFDVWAAHRGYPIFDPKTEEPIDIEDAICAVLFNFQGYLLELLHDRIASSTYDVDMAQTDEKPVVTGPAVLHDDPPLGPTSGSFTKEDMEKIRTGFDKAQFKNEEKGPLTLGEDYIRDDDAEGRGRGEN
jgi:hypothetical protein